MYRILYQKENILLQPKLNKQKDI